MTSYGVHPDLADRVQKIGVLRFDGGQSTAATAERITACGYQIVERAVPGLTPASVSSQDDKDLLTQLRAAVKELEARGVIGISGESCLMMPMQQLVSGLARVPVFLTSLLQLALMLPAHDDWQGFAIITKYPSELEQNKVECLRHCRIEVDPSRFVILALPDLGEDCVRSAAAKIGKIRRADPRLAAVVFDCEELIEHADELRAATSFPVFDQATLWDFFISARADNPYFGTCYTHYDDQGGAVSLLMRSQRGVTSPYEKFVNQLRSKLNDEVPIGVLRIDYHYPPIPGDVACSASYGYKVHFACVKGLTFEMAQRAELDEVAMISFERAVKELEELGVCAITGDCGFMMAYQPYVRSLTETPVVISSILQAPVLAAAHDESAEFAVLTSNCNSFDKELLLAQSGVRVDTSKWTVLGLQDLPGFEAVALGRQVSAELVQRGVLTMMRAHKAKTPNLRGVLLECTELPHYADALRAELKLPVLDAITLVDYFQGSCAGAPSFCQKMREAFLGAMNPAVLASVVVDQQSRSACAVL